MLNDGSDGSAIVLGENEVFGSLPEQLTTSAAERNTFRDAAERANEEARRFTDQVAIEKHELTERIRDLEVQLSRRNKNSEAVVSSLASTNKNKSPNAKTPPRMRACMD